METSQQKFSDISNYDKSAEEKSKEVFDCEKFKKDERIWGKI